MRETVDAIRVPPQAIEAEQNVLGVLLLNNAAWDNVQDVVSEADFYTADHRTIFAHIGQLIEENKPADVLTVHDSLTSRGSAIARSYLGSLAMNCVATHNARTYAQIVRDRAQRRAVIAAAMDLAERGYETRGDACELVQGAIEDLYRIEQRQARGARPVDAILTAVVERIDSLYARQDKSGVIGVPSGFVDLDRQTAGFQGGDLIIIAGRPSMGKTALAMNIVEHVAVALKLPALVFSLEMSDEQLMQRMIGSVGHLDQHALRTGTFPEADWERLTNAVGKLNDAPIIIEETGGLTVSGLRAVAHRKHRERGGLGLIVVDYLQLMSSSGENRNNELGEITRSLKALAKELRVPVIALSQLNRGVEQRNNKRPVMSDLRDSGAIEQDADLILMLYRDEVYDTESEDRGVAEVIIGKQRSGPIGTIYLTFLGKYARFENFAGQMRPRQPKRAPRVTNFDDYKTRQAGDA